MICIDRAMGDVKGRKWCHLFDDHCDLVALHAFAAGIGLKRHWFQRSRIGFPHYDVRGSMITTARIAGATPVGREAVVAALKIYTAGRKT